MSFCMLLKQFKLNNSTFCTKMISVQGRFLTPSVIYRS